MSNSRKCTVKLLDEVNCVFIGLHPDHVGALYDKYAAHANNYFFNPKFKLGSWDGKIRYFFKTGKTFIFLLDDILPEVTSLGYKVNIIDERKTPAIDVPNIDENFLADRGVLDDDGNPWIMRDYQVDMVNTLINNEHGVGIAGTGAGKTSITASIALSYELAAGFKTIIIVPDKNLTNQTKSEYARFTLDVGEYSGTNKDINHQHVVSTWQALQNNPTIIQSFDMVIIDECHGLRGKVLQDLLTNYGKNIPFRFGVTGTLPKGESDRFAVRIAVGKVLYTKPAHELIDEGHLAKVHIDIYQHTIDLHEKHEEFLRDYPDQQITYTKFRDSYFPDFAAEKAFLQKNADRIEWLRLAIETKRDQRKGNTLCLVNGVRVGKKLAKLIPGSHFVYGKDDIEVRKQIYELFKKYDDVVVFATVNIAAVGLDIKRIFNLFLIDLGKSFVRVIQAIGRGLRKAHDKDSVYVADITSDLKYSRKHTRERMKYYKEAKYPYKRYKVDIS